MSLSEASWHRLAAGEHWPVYQRVLLAASSRSLPFAVGGAFALAVYSGKLRDTKDLDLIVTPDRKDEMIEIVTGAGFQDYHGQLPYDRRWIYRGWQNGAIVDVIWAMANQKAQVDHQWLSRGPVVKVGDEVVRAAPAEEMLWAKLYVLQRDRCDWPDVMNILYSAGPSMDWHHLLARVGEDRDLLRAAMTVFAWLCPGRSRELPRWLWIRLNLAVPPPDAPDIVPRRADLLDGRRWLMPEGRNDDIRF